MDSEILDSFDKEKVSEKIYIYISLGLLFLNVLFFSNNEYVAFLEAIEDDPLNDLISYTGFGVLNIILIILSVVCIQFFLPLFFSFFYEKKTSI